MVYTRHTRSALSSIQHQHGHLTRWRPQHEVHAVHGAELPLEQVITCLGLVGVIPRLHERMVVVGLGMECKCMGASLLNFGVGWSGVAGALK